MSAEPEIMRDECRKWTPVMHTSCEIMSAIDVCLTKIYRDNLNAVKAYVKVYVEPEDICFIIFAYYGLLLFQ